MNFVVGEEYDRPSLLNYVGSSQQQTGIIWGAREPSCLIITTGGKHGKSAGYADSQNPDGTWTYIGQGSKGDQDPTRYANSLLIKGNRDILLFTTRESSTVEVKLSGNRSKKYKFRGIYDVVSWDLKKALSGDRKGDLLLEVHLIDTQNVYDKLDVISASSLPIGKDEEYYRERLSALKYDQNRDVKLRRTVSEYNYRSTLIRDYALFRAKGNCELCERIAPFISSLNIPFLEVHHIHKLADDGPDLPENVAAICPNCHREAHFGINKDKIKEKLIEIICNKEAANILA